MEYSITAEEVSFSRLNELEIVIAKGLETFVDVGLALLEIRDDKLYKAKFPTFDDYCRDRWNLSRIHAHRLIESAEVVQNLLPTGNILPENERQARELSGLEPDKQREAWEEVLNSGDKITADRVKAAAKKIQRQERSDREEKAKATAIEKAQNAPRVTDQYQVTCLDIRDVDIAPESIDAIVTDPPYPGEFIETFRWLAEKAAVWLKDGGSMFVMSGECFLPQVFERLCSVSGLNYQWTLRYELVGENQPFIGRRINCGWKPIIWMVKGKYEGRSFGDTVKSTFEDERHHKWGQTESGLRSLVERISDPAQTVLDPFCGGGSTGVACVQLNRKFIGVDIEEGCVATTLNRLIEASVQYEA